MKVDQQQFKKWHQEYRARLVNGMTTLVKDREVAEEVTAAALAIAWEHLNTFRGNSSLYTWVYRIAMNEALSRKSRRPDVSLDTLERPLKELAVLDDIGNESQDKASDVVKLKRALHAIPPVYRRVLRDHFVRDRSIKQIAGRDGIPVGTVLSRLFRAKQLLRAAWKAAT
jgi:RNA polymerase sigma-70 factor (ECF subfamily)